MIAGSDLPLTETAGELRVPGARDFMKTGGGGQGWVHVHTLRANGSLTWSGRDRFTARWRRADAGSDFTLRMGRRGPGCRRPHRRTAGGVGLRKLTGSPHSLDMHLQRREGPAEVSHPPVYIPLPAEIHPPKPVIIISLLSFPHCEKVKDEVNILKFDLLHTRLKILQSMYFFHLAVTSLLMCCPPRYRQAPVGSQGPCSSYASYSGTWGNNSSSLLLS